jgi:hypothetical protein
MLLAILSSYTTGSVGNPISNPLPPPIPSISLSTTQVYWTYPTLADLLNFTVKTSADPKSTWGAGTLLIQQSPDTPSIPLSIVPAGAAVVMVKPVDTAGQEAFTEARQLLGGGGGGGGGVVIDPDIALWPFMPLIANLAASDKINLTAAQLTGTITGQPDISHVISANASGKTFTFNGQGSAGHWCILRGNSDSNNPADWPELTNCKIDLTGTYAIIGYGLRLNNCAIKIHDGSWLRVCGAFRYGNVSTYNAATDDWINANSYTTIYGATSHVRVDSNEYTDYNGAVNKAPVLTIVGRQVLQTDPAPSYIDWCWEYVYHLGTPTGITGAVVWACFKGRDFYTDLYFNAFANLIQDIKLIGQGIEVKANYGTIRHLHIIASEADTVPCHLRNRHGRHASIHDNLLEQQGSVNPGNIECRDVEGEVYQNQCLKSDGTTGLSQILLYDGNLDGDNWFPDPKYLEGGGQNYPNAKRWAIDANNVDAVVVGAPSPTGGINTQDNTVANDVPSNPDRNRKITHGSETNTTYTTSGTKTYGAALQTWVKSDVGIGHTPQRGPSSYPGARSGLTWMSGVTVPDNSSGMLLGSGGIRAFENFRKRKVDIVNVKSSGGNGFSALVNSITSNIKKDVYKSLYDEGICVSQVIDFIPRDYSGTANGTKAFKDCIAGNFDGYYTSILNALKGYSKRKPYFLRVGHELDGTSVGPSDDSDAHAANYKAAFRYFVSMAKNSINDVLIDWNWLRRPNYSHTDAYPGDDYVDIYGADIYFNPGSDAVVNYNSHMNLFINETQPDGASGPGSFATEAVAKSKVTGFAELGLANQGAPHSAYDSAEFVQGMWDWLNANSSSVAYEIWFNIFDSGSGKHHEVIPSAANPDGSAKYATLWKQTGYVNGTP